jgi:PAS domain S-box-containing protein
MSNAALRSSKYLEQARLRIRSKFQSKFPAALAPPQSSHASVARNAMNVPSSQADTPLEQARLRIRNRFLTKFPTSSTLASGDQMKQPSMGASSAAAKDDKYYNLEEARHRIRNRFQREFLPDFEAFPNTIDTAIPAMLNEKWGTKNAAVITSSLHPYRIVCVNSCWEQLCGFTSEEAIGETFASLGIENSSFTDRVKSGYLDQKLEKGERAAVYLHNQTKDGKSFTNYLRVTPLTDHSTTAITHFLGVLQDAGNTNSGIGTNA